MLSQVGRPAGLPVSCQKEILPVRVGGDNGATITGASAAIGLPLSAAGPAVAATGAGGGSKPLLLIHSEKFNCI
jgi:hypothetical protein